MHPSTEPLPPHYRRNFRLLTIGYISFGTALTFISVTSVMPALAGELTRSAPLIGLAGTIFSGGWFLPQLFVARLVQGKPRQKPYMLMGAAGRITLPLSALALWMGLAQRRAAMLAFFYACLAVFVVADAFGSVPWFDILARAIPASRRGRLIGIAQVVTGILGIGVGALVGFILDSPRLPFPRNYALLFALASLALLPSTVALTLVAEPPPAQPTGRGTTDRSHAQRLRAVAGDPEFRRIVLCRLFVSMVELTTPFFVGHAEHVLHLPRSIIGGFVVAQTVGSILASGALGLVSERWGTRAVVRVGSAVTVLGPLFALGAHWVGGAFGRAYPFVYFTLGVFNAIRLLGFSNYLLEIAPEGLRPAYIGLANTLGGLVMVMPPLGGWLLEATSYGVLFAVGTALVGIGFALSLALKPSPRS